MPPRKRRQKLPPAFTSVRLHPPPVSLADVDDLLMEILLRLPAKSLTRFKSVCKKWLSIISSDDLCHLHTLRRPKLQPSIILQFELKCFYLNPTITINGEKKMIPYSLSVPYNIVQACNGLMLLELCGSYYVYNPTTRQSREILSIYNESPDVEAIGLAFDPSKSPYYKIVCIRTTENDFEIYQIGDLDIYQIEVYDSESHTWKLSLELQFSDGMRINTYGTYWNNSIYWSSDAKRSYSCYDIGKNEFKTLSFPDIPPNFDECKLECFDTYLQESDGQLYHCEYFNEEMWLEHEGKYLIDKESVIVLVWELVGDADSQWIFMDDHHLTCTKDCDPYYILTLRSMGGSGSDRDGDGDCDPYWHCSLLTFWAGKMRAYNFFDRSYEDILDFTTQPFYHPDRKRVNVQYFQFGEVLALV